MILKKKTSVRDIARLLDSEEEVKRLTFSRGAYTHLPKQAIAALRKMNIDIRVIDMKRGKAATTDVEKIRKLAESGLRPKEIAEQTSIPLRTVYYHFKRIKTQPR